MDDKSLQKTAFGELLVVQPKPMIQLDFIYGLRTKTDTITYVDSAASGTITLNTNSNATKEAKVSSGTGASSFAILRSIRTLRYRAAQGLRFKFTARFSNGVANNSQRVGAFNFGNEVSFGYNGTSFGILHKYGGMPQIVTLTLSAAATGNETATITLNGVGKTVAITNGSISHNVNEIAAATIPDWDYTQNGSTVVFVSKTDGPLAGAYTFSSTGTAAGTFATTSTGIAATNAWVAQSSWNTDKCNGAGPSGFNLNPQKGNIYIVAMQYLGYGPISYSVENEDGQIILVHRTNWPNNNVTPTFSVPIFRAGIVSINSGATTAVPVYCASFAGLLEGELSQARMPDSKSAAKASIGTTATPVISIRNRISFNSVPTMTTLLFHLASAGIDGAKPANVQLILNATLTEPNWTYQDTTNSVVEYDTTATALTLGSRAQVLQTFSLGKSESRSSDLGEFDILLDRGETMTIAVTASAATTDAVCSMTWHED